MAYLFNAAGFGARAFIPIFGRVVWVTRPDDGPQEGTLRWALAQANAGSTVIKFRIGGVLDIDLARYGRPRTQGGDRVFIDGFSAPTPVELQRGGLYVVNASDVVIRGLKIRPGLPGNQEAAHGPGGERGLSLLADEPGMRAARVLIDHCDLGWTTDESFNVWGNYSHVTVQWCLLSPGIGYRAIEDQAGPVPGTHGILLGWPPDFPAISPNARWFTVHHCLLDNFYQRTCETYDCQLDFCNNVVSNWALSSNLIRCRVNLRSNVFWPRVTPVFFPMPRPFGLHPDTGPMAAGSIYVADNVCTTANFAGDQWRLLGGIHNDTDQDPALRRPTPWPVSLTAEPPLAAARKVLGAAGCIQPGRGGAWSVRDPESARAVIHALAARGASGLF
mgnify:CR=1 FL=1